MLFRWYYPIWNTESGGYPTPLFCIDNFLSGQYPAVTDFFALLSFSKVCTDLPITIQDLERSEQFLRAALLHDGLLVLVPEIIIFPKMRTPALLVLGGGWNPNPHVERYHFAFPQDLICAVQRVISHVPMHLSYISWDQLYLLNPEKIPDFFKIHVEAKKNLKSRPNVYAAGAGCGYFKRVAKDLVEYVARQRYYDAYIGERVLLSLYKSPITAYLSEPSWSQIDFLRYVRSRTEIYFKDNRHIGYFNEIDAMYDQVLLGDAGISPVRLPFMLSCVLSYARTREQVLDVTVEIRNRLATAMKDVWHNIFDMDRIPFIRDRMRIEQCIRECIYREVGYALGLAGDLRPAMMLSAAAAIVGSQDASKAEEVIMKRVLAAVRRPSFWGIMEIAEVATEMERVPILYEKLKIPPTNELVPRSFDGRLVRFM